MTELPARVVADIDELEREFGPLDVSIAELDVVVIGLALRGVDVRVVFGTNTYPVDPPEILCDDAWSHPNIGARGVVIGLLCQAGWNRTYGLCQAVRELHARMMETPPSR